MNSLLQRLRQIVGSAGDAASDAQLLSAYAGGQADVFEELVRRHGRMVFGVCRRMLGNEHDADDAFQATFMVLARKAGSLTRQESVASWLYGVACRTAMKARVSAGRRRKREEVVATMTREETSDDVPEALVCPVLDEEVNRLPEKYRLPVLLCYLEGESNEEAARRMRCSIGAIKMRLLRARELLRNRLTRRGVAISAVALGTLLERSAASAAVPAISAASIVNAANAFAAGSASSASGAAALAQGVIRDMQLAKMKLAAAVVVGLGLLGIGIGLAVESQGIPSPQNSDDDAAAVAADDKVAKPKPEKEEEAGPIDKNSAAARNNRFGFELLGRVARPDANAFLSPYSISAALSMTYAGARGDTAKEMADTLHFAPDQDKWHPAFAGLSADLRPAGAKPPYELFIANRLWGQKGHPFFEPFLKVTRDHYGAGIEPVDFKEDTEGARKIINTWVEKQTKDKIQELIKRPDLTPNTRLVLTNAIYFKSQWQRPFEPEMTRPTDFRRPGADAVKVPMMQDQHTYGYAEGDGFQAINLPYKDRALSMVVVLPKKVDGLEAVEKNLDAAQLQEVLGKMKPQKVNVYLPKFKLLENYYLEDEKILPAMGMRKAFAAREADFSGICSDPLYIAKVIHKAMVNVDEKGTEAAAATAVVMEFGGVFPAAKPIEFKADHPFLFLIRDNKTGAVLFLGRLVNPETK